MSLNLFSPSFRGGLHLRDYKWLTENLPIKKAPISKKVRIPLSQHAGKPAAPVVKMGDAVKTGQLIGAMQGIVSANVHSSITGKVTAIDKFPDPVCGESLCVEIQGDGVADEIVNLNDDAKDIIGRIKSAGIVGMGGAMFPTHIKLQPPSDKKIDTFILNAAECEPYITSDYRLLIEKTDEILSGLKIMMKATVVEKAYIGIEDNKPEAIKTLTEKCSKPEFRHIPVVVLPAKYPQGGEKQLIKSVLGREVPSGKLPFDVGVIVQNVGTAYAVHEAVVLSKPFYERVVTVTGSCVKEPGNWLVRVGTLVGDLIEQTGGLKSEPGKVIMGGPMMGIAQYTMDVPVVKGTNAILVLSKNEVFEAKKEVCIRCGKCLLCCPMGLDPGKIATLVEKGKLDEAVEAGALDCIECGLCAYECPSNRDIVQLVKHAKKQKK